MSYEKALELTHLIFPTDEVLKMSEGGIELAMKLNDEEMSPTDGEEKTRRMHTFDQLNAKARRCMAEALDQVFTSEELDQYYEARKTLKRFSGKLKEVNACFVSKMLGNFFEDLSDGSG